MSVFDENGQPVQQAELKKELVRCDLDEAQDAAESFLKRGFGEDILLDVDIKRGELLFRGSFFVYNFTWREPISKDGVALWFKWIHVNVNPETCQVADFAHAESVPSEEPAIDAEAARRVVMDARSEKGAIEITRLGLVELKRPVAPPILAWAVSFQSPAIGLAEPTAEIIVESCYVNAESGEVFESASSLLKAAAESE
jgi:hypothetical protein